MKSLFQRNWYTEVRRNDSELLIAKTSYVDTNREAVAYLWIDINSFLIKDAYWEEQRSEKPIIQKRQVTPLIECEAYFTAGPALKKVDAFLNDSLAVDLFSETIKGVIQAETFLLSERGFASEEDYENKWKQFYFGSCRYFSNLDRAAQGWYDHVGDSKRNGNLFIRFKTQSLFSISTDLYLLSGNMSDSFHEVNVRLKLENSTVIEADGVLLRTPDLVCRESSALLTNLQGTDVYGISKKELASILGKGQGCIHVIDLVSDCVQIINSLHRRGD